MKRLVIFGQRIQQLERQKYDCRVTVQFQPNAWCDEAMFLFWARHMWRRDVAERKLLVIDSHRAQLTQNALKVMDEACNTSVVSIGGGLTSVLQPLDLVVIRPFKHRVDEIFNQHLSSNLDAYTNITIPAGKRILMTQWIGQSWMEVMASLRPTIQRVFITPGISVVADGSEDDIFAIQAIENYTYAVFSEEESNEES